MAIDSVKHLRDSVVPWAWECGSEQSGGVLWERKRFALHPGLEGCVTQCWGRSAVGLSIRCSSDGETAVTNASQSGVLARGIGRWERRAELFLPCSPQPSWPLFLCMLLIRVQADHHVSRGRGALPLSVVLPTLFFYSLVSQQWRSGWLGTHAMGWLLEISVDTMHFQVPRQLYAVLDFSHGLVWLCCTSNLVLYCQLVPAIRDMSIGATFLVRLVFSCVVDKHHWCHGR